MTENQKGNTANINEANDMEHDNTSKKTIFHNQHKNNFTVISNSTIQDGSVSFKARGLHHFLLSLPDTWKANINHLASTSDKDGKAAVTSALNELINAGYVIRETERSSETGQFSTTIYKVFESPQPTIQKSDSGQSPLSDFPRAGFPEAGFPLAGNRSHIKETYLENTDLKNTHTKKSVCESQNAQEPESGTIADSEPEVIEAEIVSEPESSELTIVPDQQSQQPEYTGWRSEGEIVPRQSQPKSCDVQKWIDIYNREKPESWAEAFATKNLGSAILRFHEDNPNEGLRIMRLALLKMRIIPDWHTSPKFGSKNMAQLFKHPMNGGDQLVYVKAGEALSAKLTDEMLDAVEKYSPSDSDLRKAQAQYRTSKSPAVSALRSYSADSERKQKAIETELERADRIDRERKGLPPLRDRTRST